MVFFVTCAVSKVAKNLLQLAGGILFTVDDVLHKTGKFSPATDAAKTLPVWMLTDTPETGPVHMSAFELLVPIMKTKKTAIRFNIFLIIPLGFTGLNLFVDYII